MTATAPVRDTTVGVPTSRFFAARRRGSGSASRLRRLVMCLVILAGWQAYVALAHVRALLVPSPLQVGQALVEDLANGKLLVSAAFTLRTLVIGTLLGMSIGLFLAALAVVSRLGQDLLSLLVSIFNPLPSIAILPLALIWFGLTPTAIVFVVLNSTIWPVALNTDMGFRTVSPTLQRAARTLGISGPRMVLQILLPAALPYLLSGVRMAWAFAWRTVVAAELIFGVAGGKGGLGYYINQSRYFLETPRVFAGLVLISVLGLLIEVVFGQIEKRTVERWGMTRAA